MIIFNKKQLCTHQWINAAYYIQGETEERADEIDDIDDWLHLLQLSEMIQCKIWFLKDCHRGTFAGRISWAALHRLRETWPKLRDARLETLMSPQLPFELIEINKYIDFLSSFIPQNYKSLLLWYTTFFNFIWNKHHLNSQRKKSPISHLEYISGVLPCLAFSNL